MNIPNESSESKELEGKNLQELFALADEIGKQRYHKLTAQDLEEYKRFDYWRYINGSYECGTTQESRDWVKENSGLCCPICGEKFSKCGGRTIDHKLPRSQYPWLSMNLDNLWVICKACNEEKGEMHWFEYELYLFVHHPDWLPGAQRFRPTQLLKSLRQSVG